MEPGVCRRGQGERCGEPVTFTAGRGTECCVHSVLGSTLKHSLPQPVQTLLIHNRDRELTTLQAASFVLEWFFCKRIPLFPVRLLSLGLTMPLALCLFPGAWAKPVLPPPPPRAVVFLNVGTAARSQVHFLQSPPPSTLVTSMAPGFCFLLAMLPGLVVSATSMGTLSIL